MKDKPLSRSTPSTARRLLSLSIAMFLSVAPQAQEWRQFRGPTGQGVAEGTDLPVNWSETSNVAWKIPVPGRGWSSPVVAHGRVWLTSAVPYGRDASLRLLSFDAESGRAAQDVEVVRLQRAELLNVKNSQDRKSTRLNSSHLGISYAVFCF